MNIVIDTNIVVSAVLKDRDPEAVIRFVIGHPQYEWVASRDILAEYANVLRRPKFRLPEALLQEWADVFATVMTLVDVAVVVDFPRDQKDAKFLACARRRGRLSHYRRSRLYRSVQTTHDNCVFCAPLQAPRD